MPFTVRDFGRFVRALERRAGWKAELRWLVLTDELLGLPQLFAEAQRRTEERLGRLVDHQELGLLPDDAVEAGRVTPDARGEILLADLVLRGRQAEREVYLLAEVSALIDVDDVERARARVDLLGGATGTLVVAAVAGRGLTAEALEVAERVGVLRVLDGR